MEEWHGSYLSIAAGTNLIKALLIDKIHLRAVEILLYSGFAMISLLHMEIFLTYCQLGFCFKVSVNLEQ